MSGSYSQIVQGMYPWDFPARTPGSLGINDAAAPGSPFFFLGDTPGSVGVNDGAAETPGAFLPPPPTADVVLEEASRFLVKCEWPRPTTSLCVPSATSGITWGVGWDASQQSAATLRSEWGALPESDLLRLEPATDKKMKGPTAKALLLTISDIKVPIQLSLDVFRYKTLPRYYRTTKKAFPGVDRLPAKVQTALISLVYNRGGGMTDGKKHPELHDRQEMRDIRDAVDSEDLPAIATLLRKMERVWAGTDIERGMHNRREEEAKLVDTAIKDSREITPSINQWKNAGCIA